MTYPVHYGFFMTSNSGAKLITMLWLCFQHCWSPQLTWAAGTITESLKREEEELSSYCVVTGGRTIGCPKYPILFPQGLKISWEKQIIIKGKLGNR